MFAPNFPVAPGTLVSTPTHLVYRHYGIVTEWGLVISNSARCGGIAEETFKQFANGKDWRVERRPSNLPWWTVVARARAHAGRPYDLLTWNCECFINDSYGLKPESKQVAITLLAAAFGMIVMAGMAAN